MKKFLVLLLLSTGCVAVWSDRTPSYPVELPGGISGIYIECVSDLACESRAVGVCTNGYWIAEYVHSASSDTSNTKPFSYRGEVIVCGKAPSQQ